MFLLYGRGPGFEGAITFLYFFVCGASDAEAEDERNDFCVATDPEKPRGETEGRLFEIEAHLKHRRASSVEARGVAAVQNVFENFVGASQRYAVVVMIVFYEEAVLEEAEERTLLVVVRITLLSGHYAPTRQ